MHAAFGYRVCVYNSFRIAVRPLGDVIRIKAIVCLRSFGTASAVNIPKSLCLYPTVDRLALTLPAI